MPVFLLVTTVLLLIVTISWLKVHPFVALLGFGLVFGLVNGLDGIKKARRRNPASPEKC